MKVVCKKKNEMKMGLFYINEGHHPIHPYWVLLKFYNANDSIGVGDVQGLQGMYV